MKITLEIEDFIRGISTILVHTSVPIGKAMKILVAKTAVDKE